VTEGGFAARWIGSGSNLSDLRTLRMAGGRPVLAGRPGALVGSPGSGSLELPRDETLLADGFRECRRSGGELVLGHVVGRGPLRWSRLLLLEMAEDLVDDRGVGEEGEDSHRVSTLAKQGIRLVDAPDELRPLSPQTSPFSARRSVVE